jgi:hypothetical protein
MFYCHVLQENTRNLTASSTQLQSGSMVSAEGQLVLNLAMLPQLVARLQLPIGDVEAFVSYLCE